MKVLIAMDNIYTQQPEQTIPYMSSILVVIYRLRLQLKQDRLLASILNLPIANKITAAHLLKWRATLRPVLHEICGAMALIFILQMIQIVSVPLHLMAQRSHLSIMILYQGRQTEYGVTAPIFILLIIILEYAPTHLMAQP